METDDWQRWPLLRETAQRKDKKSQSLQPSEVAGVYRNPPPGGNRDALSPLFSDFSCWLSVFYMQQCPGQAFYHLKMTSGSRNSLTYKENELKD